MKIDMNKNDFIPHRQFRFFSSSLSSEGETEPRIENNHNADANMASSASRSNIGSSSSNSSSSNSNSNNNQRIISDDEYDPLTTENNILKSAKWNQGGGTDGKWDPKFCVQSVKAYKEHLKYIQHYIMSNNSNTDSNANSQNKDSNNNNNNNNNNSNNNPTLPLYANRLVTSKTTSRALKAMLKMNLPTNQLSQEVRSLERLIGSISLTPLTDNLSLRLLEANGKAGNIGRSLSLLNLRKSRGYKPTTKEYEYAIQSIVSAGLHLRKDRNLFVDEHNQPEIDNPTRWLDAILVNMSGRNVPLDTWTANRMLHCYACTGRSGKALHFFYDVKRDYMDVEEDEEEEGVDVNVDVGVDDGEEDKSDTVTDERTPTQKLKVRMKIRPQLPPFYKIPSDVKLNREMVKRRGKDEIFSTKLEWEKEKDWSPSLTAAFAFADSLTHGACGHAPIKLDVSSWNTLIKASCYRGAIWRALEILNDTMPRNNIEPDIYSYNTILAALARLGDKDFMREMLTAMTNKGIISDKCTVQALVDGYLNAGDISGAVTLVQDMWNQHHVLPPYTSHLKIIEFALATELVYEAKRHVYLIQQLMKWKPSPEDSNRLQKFMYITQRNPKLSRKSLQQLFSYFGETLTEEDFF